MIDWRLVMRPWPRLGPLDEFDDETNGDPDSWLGEDEEEGFDDDPDAPDEQLDDDGFDDAEGDDDDMGEDGDEDE